MRHGAPAPKGCRSETLCGGYQLCARCGEVLVDGDLVVVVSRSPSWHIYTHPAGQGCKPKAVKGWKAVRRAEGIRDSSNALTPRRAEPVRIGSKLREAVCLLDDKHINAELALVDDEPSDEEIEILDRGETPDFVPKTIIGRTPAGDAFFHATKQIPFSSAPSNS